MDPEYRVGKVASFITDAAQVNKTESNEKLSKLFSASTSVVNTRPVIKINTPKPKKKPPPPPDVPKIAPVASKTNQKSKATKSQATPPPKPELKKKWQRAKKFREIKAAKPSQPGAETEETEPTESCKNGDTAEKLSRTLFIGNLPISTTKKLLVKVFRGCGKVTSARLRSAIPGDNTKTKKAAIIKKDFHATSTTLNGYVVFEKTESAKDALKKNGTVLDGHHIRVDLASNNRQHDHRRSIFVGNLSFDIKDDDLRNHFEKFGDVVSVRVIRDARTGLGKGFGYVLFEDSDSVSFALRAKDSTLRGRQIRVKRSTDEKSRVSVSSSNSQMKQRTQTVTPKPRNNEAASSGINGKANKKLRGFDAVKDRKRKKKEKKQKMSVKSKRKLGERILGKKVASSGSAVTVGHYHKPAQDKPTNTDHNSAGDIVNNTCLLKQQENHKKHFLIE